MIEKKLSTEPVDKSVDKIVDKNNLKGLPILASFFHFRINFSHVLLGVSCMAPVTLVTHFALAVAAALVIEPFIEDKVALVETTPSL